MELLEGQTLGDAMREGPMDPRKVATIGAQVASALAVAHEAGVIHRDLKPDNVFLVRSGGPPLAKVLDFGVAKLLHAAKLTRPNTVFGTPYYMSPEQATDAPIDGRVDQYALGVVMYEALTGAVPFDDPTHLGVMRKHVEEPPVDVLARMPDASNADVVGAIVMRCLAKRPEDRWESTHELARALEQAADETWFAVRSSSFVGPLPEPSRLPRAPSRRPPSSPALELPRAAVPSYAPAPAPAPHIASTDERSPRSGALEPSRPSLERMLLLILAALLAIAELLAALVFSRGMA
jgi:serine/threonine-protein kinase